MFAPGAAQLVQEFHITSSVVATFTVSIYVLGFMVGPMFLAPLSELYGRLIIYHVCNVFYLAFTLGCALSKNTPMFLVFRFIAGCASAGPLTIGGGTIADVTPQEKRGKAMAMFVVGPLLGPSIGPIIGGFATQNLGWRWTFWIILILVSSVLPQFCVQAFLTAVPYSPVALPSLRSCSSGRPMLLSYCNERPSVYVRRQETRSSSPS